MLDLADQFPDAEIFLFTAIMHTFTGLHNADELKKNVMNSLKLFIACGVDPKRFVIYNPADIPAHAQLNWVFSCLTIM
jgi:tryptophanyl-tRNA synthetase